MLNFHVSDDHEIVVGTIVTIFTCKLFNIVTFVSNVSLQAVLVAVLFSAHVTLYTGMASIYIIVIERFIIEIV